MFYGVDLTSRLMLGTAQYPSPQVLLEAIEASGAQVITVSLRREGRPEGVSCPSGEKPVSSAAQHRGLSHRSGSRDHGPNGT